jgi:plasmid stability protein
MEQQREVDRPLYRQRVVFAEDPRVARALEERAVAHGRSVAAEVRAAVREHLRRREGPA